MKQSTMHDEARTAEDIFKYVRPSIVVGEASSADTFAPEVVAAHSADNVVDMNVRMSNVFEGQFVSQHFARIFRGR